MTELENLYLFRILGSKKKLIGSYSETYKEFTVLCEPDNFYIKEKDVVWKEKLDCKIHVSKLAQIGFCGDVLDVENNVGTYQIDLTANNCQPILRSLDRMTLAEKRDLSEICFPDEDYLFVDAIIIDENNMLAAITLSGDKYYMPRINLIDWLTAKGFSIRGEIESGLAIKEDSDV